MGAILIADDEPGILEVLKWELGNLGHRVSVVSNGAAALAEIRRTEFDVVISDMRMPGASGLDVLSCTKAQWPETEVLVATAYAELETAIECVRGGAFALVQKPFEMGDLFANVARALARRELRATTSLYQASQVILATNDMTRLPSVIAQVTAKVMMADDVSLMLTGAGDTLYIAGADGSVAERKTPVLAMGSRVAGRVAESREPALIQSDLANDARFADIESLRPVQSSIVYPLCIGDRLVGILNINRVSNPRPFGKADLSRAAVIASQAVLALENRRLMQSVATSERLAAIGQLAAGVAHEINNPVACVIAAHDFLRDRLVAFARFDRLFAEGADIATLQRERETLGGPRMTEELLEALADADEGATQIRDIVRDIRSLAKNEDEKPTRVYLNEVVRSALRLAGAEIRPNAKVVSQLGEGAEVDAHAGRLAQVFVNLFVNAAQALGAHRQRGNQITVTTHRDGDQVIAEVSDNGPGIAAEHLPRLFEPFFTTKGATTGTGLGLSISRDIVKRYGGELRVESLPGAGAKFTVVLPAAKNIF
jgi:signal transduction histidine kinase/CheY-like chemotaxis protein